MRRRRGGGLRRRSGHLLRRRSRMVNRGRGCPRRRRCRRHRCGRGRHCRCGAAGRRRGRGVGRVHVVKQQVPDANPDNQRKQGHRNHWRHQAASALAGLGIIFPIRRRLAFTLGVIGRHRTFQTRGVVIGVVISPSWLVPRRRVLLVTHASGLPSDSSWPEPDSSGSGSGCSG